MTAVDIGDKRAEDEKLLVIYQQSDTAADYVHNRPCPTKTN
jgi:hypothetical protein